MSSLLAISLRIGIPCARLVIELRTRLNGRRLNGFAARAHISVQFGERDARMLLHPEEPHVCTALIALGTCGRCRPFQIFRYRLHELIISIIGIESIITFHLLFYTLIERLSRSTSICYLMYYLVLQRFYPSASNPRPSLLSTFLPTALLTNKPPFPSFAAGMVLLTKGVIDGHTITRRASADHALSG